MSKPIGEILSCHLGVYTIVNQEGRFCPVARANWPQALEFGYTGSRLIGPRPVTYQVMLISI
jgi:hypothetical protein